MKQRRKLSETNMREILMALDGVTIVNLFCDDEYSKDFIRELTQSIQYDRKQQFEIYILRLMMIFSKQGIETSPIMFGVSNPNLMYNIHLYLSQCILHHRILKEDKDIIWKRYQYLKSEKYKKNFGWLPEEIKNLC